MPFTVVPSTASPVTVSPRTPLPFRECPSTPVLTPLPRPHTAEAPRALHSPKTAAPVAPAGRRAINPYELAVLFARTSRRTDEEVDGAPCPTTTGPPVSCRTTLPLLDAERMYQSPVLPKCAWLLFAPAAGVRMSSVALG